MQANLSEEEIRKQEEELRKKRLAEEIVLHQIVNKYH